MSIRELKIVYMGTPEFAVAPLEKLLEAGCNVVAVITAPDRPAGRGKKITFSAVKKYALMKGLNILQPENLKQEEFVSELKTLAPDLQVVVAFRMLPEVVWGIPGLGTFNLHASLLPQYRGAAPINHVIINGESRTGVSSFMIDSKIDTGNILLQEAISIGEDENAGELHDRLMELGAEIVLKTTRQLAEGSLKALPQDDWIQPGMKLNNAPKIHKADCRINWEKPAREIHNLVRGLSPYPASFTSLDKGEGQTILFKIYATRIETASHDYSSGTILTDGRKEMKIAVRDGFMHILSLQQEGKKRMNTPEFLLGFKMSSGQYRFS